MQAAFAVHSGMCTRAERSYGICRNFIMRELSFNRQPLNSAHSLGKAYNPRRNKQVQLSSTSMSL